MAEKPTADELVEKGVWAAREWLHEHDFGECNASVDTCPDWPLAYEITRAVLEAAGVPALLERVQELEQEQDEATFELALELSEERTRCQSAKARVAQLEDDVNRLGDAFARLYLQALNGVVCDPTGEPGTRGCCRECHNAWASGKAVLDKHDPGWGGLQRARVFRVGEPRVGRDRRSAEGDSALPDPSKPKN
jgi:hypothetical protein